MSTHILMAGASGLLGTHLTAHFTAQGHTVTHLVRRQPQTGRPDGVTEARWDPANGTLDESLVAQADVVVNLAGSPLVGNVHSASWARDLLASRVSTTRLLAEAIAQQETPPAFLAGNGISFYGDHGDARLDEESPSRGDALLTRVTRAWQEAAEPARTAGARLCVLRTAVVLDGSSMPFKALDPAHRFKVAPLIGTGQQYFPVVSLRDWVRAVGFLAESQDLSGAFNLVCPTVPTYREFAEALAGSPVRLRVPAKVVKVAAGPMAPELLNSVRAVPQALHRAGFDFLDEEITSLVDSARQRRR